MMATRGFGVDVGGSGIKGGVVDLEQGQLIGEKIRISTPQPSTPDAVADTVAHIVQEAGWGGPLGIALPSVIKEGSAHTAANIDRTWIGTDALALFTQRLERQPEHITIMNDADAAGVAEMKFGDSCVRTGITVLLTFGTGIGSAVFHRGELLPNTELGHLEIDGFKAERRAAASVKDQENLSYPEWASRVNRYLTVVENLLWPDVFILGGGVSKKWEKWVPLLNVRTKVIVAALHNNAGIVGAAAIGMRHETGNEQTQAKNLIG